MSEPDHGLASEILAVGPKDSPRVFSVGPYGNRVNFAFQQRRALSLVYGLDQTFDAEKNEMTVAVLGGGVAGLTTCLALKRVGFRRITLYEANRDVLSTQAAATHRYIHPGYSDWPSDTSTFAATTDFPLLNWHCGNAYEVAEQIRRQWEAEFKDGDINLKSGRIVKLVTWDKNASQVVVHSFPATNRDARPPSQTAQYDLAILTLGFGDETGEALSSEGSYWDPDRLTSYRNNLRKYRRHNIIVSGTGDGGLIDFARAAFDYGINGELPIRLIARLRDKDCRKVPTKVESVPDLSSIEKKISAKEGELRSTPENGRAEASLGLQEFYLALIQELKDDEAYQLLEDAFDEGALGRISIVGLYPTPFLPETAPINKLMVAFLLHKDKDRYDQGVLRGDRYEHLYVETGANLDDNALAPNEDNLVDRKDNVLIIRHGGANPPMEKVCARLLPRDGDGNNPIRDIVTRITNRTSFGNYGDKFLTQPTDGITDDVSADFDYRFGLIQDFADKFFPESLIRAKPDNGNRIVEITLPTGPSYDTVYECLGGFDRLLYGVPVKFSFAESAPMYESGSKEFTR